MFSLQNKNYKPCRTHIPIMTAYFILQTTMLSRDNVSCDQFLIELQALRFEKAASALSAHETMPQKGVFSETH